MISILLAVYNGEKYISQSIDSVINQTFNNWELLVGFNGTTDSSKEIVNSYGDSRIKTFDYGEDKGKAKTLNKLIKEAKYDWCAIQDDDDVWLPEKLEKQIEYTKKYDVIGSFIEYINESDDVIGSPDLSSFNDDIKAKSISGINQIANSSSIFRKSAVCDVGCWDENLDKLVPQGIQPKEDFDLWLKLLKNDNLFYNIPEYLVLHRLHPQSNFNTKLHGASKILWKT